MTEPSLLRQLDIRIQTLEQGAAELKKALDAMARTFTMPVWENTAVWHWAWEYRGEKPPEPPVLKQYVTVSPEILKQMERRWWEIFK